MCIFSQPVERVAGTSIFARKADGWQWLAYEMTFAALGDLAMVLPLPVLPGSGEHTVSFIDLSSCPDFFDALRRLFAMPLAYGSFGAPQARAATLEVHQVGDFEASYVPSVTDFVRLDDRFRLSPAVWQQLPHYADWGFAVFKLRGEPRSLLERLGMRKRPTTSKKVHPMAFAFRTRSPADLFFPTLHVHDGAVHAEADFDHELYAQLPREPPAHVHGAWWRASTSPSESTVTAAAGLLDSLTPLFRLKIGGRRPNQDVVATPTPLTFTNPPASAHGEFVMHQVTATGPIASWSYVLQNLVTAKIDAFRAAFARHLGSTASLGLVQLLVDYDEGGQPERVAFESAFDAPALLAELEAIALDLRLPSIEGSGWGQLQLIMGHWLLPISPLPT
ncbi:MAG: hypothetical protein KC731_02335 [Myxococcales bacterium]|nr:hypothetical protein [Myxococcales bacterium]